MARQVAAPLTDADYKSINDLLKRCETYRRDIETAKAAGQQVDEYQQLCDSLCVELKKVKGAYFPDRP